MVTRRQAIRTIKAAGKAETVHVSAHAKDNDDEIMVEDIQHALATAWAFKLQDNGRWRVTGKDLDGDDLTVIGASELIAIVRAMPRRGGGPPPNAPERAHAPEPWNSRPRRVTVSALTVPSASASEAEQRTKPG